MMPLSPILLFRFSSLIFATMLDAPRYAFATPVAIDIAYARPAAQGIRTQ